MRVDEKKSLDMSEELRVKEGEGEREGEVKWRQGRHLPHGVGRCAMNS